MQKYLLLVLTTFFLCGLTACAQRQEPPATASQAPEYELSATVRDIMDSIVDPGADFIWESVETVVNAQGIQEKRPTTDEEWQEVRRHGIMLLEATNLLKMPGRAVAKPGEKADDPNVELPPEKIQEMIEQDRGLWNKYAKALHDATMDTLKTIEAKDADALLNTSDKIDTACENCHLHYWYPEDKGPVDPAVTGQKGGN
jgi:hypothetical protein